MIRNLIHWLPLNISDRKHDFLAVSVIVFTQSVIVVFIMVLTVKIGFSFFHQCPSGLEVNAGHQIQGSCVQSYLRH